jgi:Cation efflux family
VATDPRAGETDLLGSLSRVPGSSASASERTVWVALGANLLVGVAKSIAAVVTGSASMLAEAAHSWADTGNEVFLLIANRRSRRSPDQAHPLGYGREAYVWSLLAAVRPCRRGARPQRSCRRDLGTARDPDVARVTYLRLEIVGPRMVYIIGDVDLVGDDTESRVALRLRALEARTAPPPRWQAPC